MTAFNFFKDMDPPSDIGTKTKANSGRRIGPVQEHCQRNEKAKKSERGYMYFDKVTPSAPASPASPSHSTSSASATPETARPTPPPPPPPEPIQGEDNENKYLYDDPLHLTNSK